MGEYYRMTLWADLPSTSQTAEFLERLEFSQFFFGGSSYHNGGTVCSATRPTVGGRTQLAVVSHWRTSNSTRFKDEFLPALSDLLPAIHDALLGILVDERQAVQYIWWDGEKASLLYSDEYQKKLAEMWDG